MTGSDVTGDGSFLAPYATLAKAFSVIGAYGNHRIYVLPGTYYEGTIDTLGKEAAWDGIAVIGLGDVTFDATGHNWFIGGNNSDRPHIVLYNLAITGFEVALIRVNAQHRNPGIGCFCCLIWQQGAKRNATCILHGYNNFSGVSFFNCTLWGVRCCDARYVGARTTSEFHDCAIYTDYAYNMSYVYRCAVNNTGYTYKGAINQYDGCWYTETYPLPVFSEDPNTPNLSFDPSHAQFAKYMSGSRKFGPVGRPWPKVGWSGYSLYNSFYGTYWSSLVDDGNVDGVTAWANDASFAEAGFTPMIVDSSHTFYPDAVTNPSWTCARAISSVAYMGNSIELGRVNINYEVTGAEYIGVDIGESDTVEYRASDTAFLATDPTPAWTKINAKSGLASIGVFRKYVQFRVTIRQ